MQQHDWHGVFPAITTPFLEDLSVDHARLSKHVVWLADHGCRGIVALGSLGEAQTLGFEEKISILEAVILKTTGVEPLPLTRLDRWLQRFHIVFASIFGPLLLLVGFYGLLSELGVI